MIKKLFEAREKYKVGTLYGKEGFVREGERFYIDHDYNVIKAYCCGEVVYDYKTDKWTDIIN